MSFYSFLKRIIDIMISITVLAGCLPFFAIYWLVCALMGRLPVIFTQLRAGKNAKPFTFYKLHTMKLGVDPYGASPKTGGDPRITKFGKLLRETSLDELPQFLNILKGDMTLIGPRPLYVEQIAEWNDRQKKRLLVKPGLTGLAQVSGRGHLTREQKLEHDVRYVEKQGPLLDAKIILKTIVQIFIKQGIYEKKYSETEDTRGDGEGQ